MSTMTFNPMQIDGDGAVAGVFTLDAVTSADITDNTITSADIKAGEIVNSDLSASAAVAFSKLAALPSTNVLVGNGSNVATAVAVSGDATLANTGALTIANGAVTNAKIADSTGVGALGIRKSATVAYDFAVDGGAQGTIVLTGAPTLPDNAVVWIESYDVLTTCTSATDAATIVLQVPTDGAISGVSAISDGNNPWDVGGHYGSTKGNPLEHSPVKLTGARVPSLLVAGGENLTAGKIVFQLAYWVSS